MRRFLAKSMLGTAAVVGVLQYPLSVPTAEGPPYQRYTGLSSESHVNKHVISSVPRTIGIIGGGASGLITAKILKQQGYVVEVLEKREKFGGVWFDNYEGAGLQVPYPTYEMPDYPFPAGTPLIPKQDLVLQFFEGYVTEFDLADSIRFNSEVKAIHQLKNETWEVTLANGSTKAYDFLVNCNGPYHQPYIPQLPGAEKFEGKALHSSEFKQAKSLCQGKRVLVIGGGKSALDVLNVASEHAASTVGLMRNIQWTILGGFNIYGIPADTILFSRFASLLGTPAYCERGWAQWVLRPIGNLYWWFVGKKASEDLPSSAKPTISFQESRDRQLMTREPDYTAKLQSGRIVLQHGEIAEILPNGVQTKDGTKLEADVIVFATGFRRHHFGLKLDDGEQWRYRCILVPELRNYAVIGSMSSYGAMYMTNLQAVWLAEMLRGKVSVASVEEMQADVLKRKEYMTNLLKSPKASLIVRDDVYADMLLEDMGMQKRREKNYFEYWFRLAGPTNYRLVVTHRV